MNTPTGPTRSPVIIDFSSRQAVGPSNVYTRIAETRPAGRSLEVHATSRGAYTNDNSNKMASAVTWRRCISIVMSGRAVMSCS